MITVCWSGSEPVLVASDVVPPPPPPFLDLSAESKMPRQGRRGTRAVLDTMIPTFLLLAHLIESTVLYYTILY
jgi:hypothetical protein